jgi:hypothetical protein
MQRKPDDEAIGAFFADVTRAPWLAPKLRHWPRFFFHITDASNVVSILRDSELLCREVVQATGRMQNDNASAAVLEGTHPDNFKAVRLYFRPRTPTFWHNEGICPDGRCTKYGAHCPMPVALLFDSAAVAGQADLVVTHLDSGEISTRSFPVKTNATLRCELPRQFWHQTLRIDLYLDRFRAFSGVVDSVPSMSLLT